MVQLRRNKVQNRDYNILIKDYCLILNLLYRLIDDANVVISCNKEDVNINITCNKDGVINNALRKRNDVAINKYIIPLIITDDGY